jgi:hypothetical protein
MHYFIGNSPNRLYRFRRAWAVSSQLSRRRVGERLGKKPAALGWFGNCAKHNDDWTSVSKITYFFLNVSFYIVVCLLNQGASSQLSQYGVGERLGKKPAALGWFGNCAKHNDDLTRFSQIILIPHESYCLFV